MSNTVGPRFPTVAQDLGGGSGGAAWTPLGNLYAADGNVASGDISGGGTTSTTLLTKGYGFSLPAGAIIRGIQLDILRSGFQAIDSYVAIAKNGTTYGTDHSYLSASWPGALTYRSYGGPTDLWGLSWTAADINNALFGAALTVRNVTGGGNANVDTMRITVWWDTPPANVRKGYDYKVYSGGQFMGLIPNVTSDFKLASEINTGGGQINIEAGISADISGLATSSPLQDETGAGILDETGAAILAEGGANVIGLGTTPGALIKNGNRVVVIEYGYYYPNGHVVFQGEMERIEATYGGEDKENKVTILCYSDGSDMDNFLLLGSPFTYIIDQSQTTQNTAANLFNWQADKGLGTNYYGQTFTTGSTQTNIGGVYLLMNGVATVTLRIYDGPAMANLLGSISVNVNTGGSAVEVLLGLANHIVCTGSTQYFFTISVDSGQNIQTYFSNANPYAGGQMYQATTSGGSGGGGFGPIVGSDLYFKTANSTGQTTATYTAQDPSRGILLGFMGDYNTRGGSITASTATVDATGLSLPYQFNTNTIYEGIQSILAVSPYNFYFYVDVATDQLYFKKASTTAEVLLTKGVHLAALKLVTSIENIVNLVYFSGGKVSGSNIYKAYQDPTSINLYGQKLTRLSDNRVTAISVADAIGTSKRDENKAEQFQTTVTVLDKQMDIAALRVGMIVGFRGFGTYVDLLLLQIVRIDYEPESAVLTLGVLPPRTNDQLEAVTRGLIAAETIDNPTTPS